jgi:hypothetical protein
MQNETFDYYFNRALAYFSMDMYDKACVDLEKAKKLGDPDAGDYIRELCK